MKVSILLTSLITSVQGATVDKRFYTPNWRAINPENNGGVFKIPFEVSQKDPMDYSKIVKRDSRNKTQIVEDEMVLWNQNDLLYMANISLGTPPQNLSVLLTINDADLWVFSKSNPYCLSNLYYKRENLDYQEEEEEKEDADVATDTSTAIDTSTATATTDDYDTGILEYIQSKYEADLSDFLETNTDSSVTEIYDTIVYTTQGYLETITLSVDFKSATGDDPTGMATSTTFSLSIIATTTTGQVSNARSTLSDTGASTITGKVVNASSTLSDVGVTGRVTQITPYFYETVTRVFLTQTAVPLIDCGSVGTFDSDSSETFNDTGEWFSFQYGEDYGFAQGKVALDTLTFNEFVIEDYTFGLASASNRTYMSFGIGLTGNEDLAFYDSFPMRLVDSGYINRVVYSLFLESMEAATGSILFGGVDSAKYTGTLYAFPMLSLDSSSDVPTTSFYISIDSIDLTDNNNGSIVQQITYAKHPMQFDNSKAYFYLPVFSFRRLIDAFPGISYINNVGANLVKCDHLKEYNMSLNIQGVNYSIPLSVFGKPMSEMVQENYFSGQTIPKSEIKDYCYLQMGTSTDNTIIAGNSFLRWFYVTFDLTYYEIYMAEANLQGNTSESIQVIDAYGTIPGAKRAPNYYNVYEGNTTTPSSSDGSEPFFNGTNNVGTKYLNNGVKLPMSGHLWTCVFGAIVYFML